MRKLSRCFLAIIVAGSLAGTFMCRPTEVDQATMPLPDGAEDPAPETERLRIAVKEQITHDVFAGRRSLVEAAALFGELNRLPPALLDVADDHFSPLPVVDRTAEEYLCRQVVSWADRTLTKEAPDRAEEFTGRLVAEYQELRRRSGAVRLPDPSTLESAMDLLRDVRTRVTEQDERRGTRK